MSDENLTQLDTQPLTTGTKKEPFTCFPNYLINDPTFDSDCLSISLYLYSKAEGWQTRPFDIMKRFNISRRIWDRVSREFRLRGMLSETLTPQGSRLSFELIWGNNRHLRPSATTEKPMVENQQPAQKPMSRFVTSQIATSQNVTSYERKTPLKKDFIKQQPSLFFLKIKERLIAQGIPMNDSTLNTWIKDFGEAKVADKIELLEQSQGIDKPEAWLLSALRKDYKREERPKSNYQNEEPARRNATVEETNLLIANVLSRPKADKAKALAELAKMKRKSNAG